jgi:microcystin-dependent protein
MKTEKPINVHDHEDVDDAGELIPPPYVPVGAYFPYGGTAAPAGWLLCNGAAVSRITYAELFDAIGTAYGAGDGSTTFNIPDLRGRTVFGYESTDSAFDAIGKTGGAQVVDSEHVHPVDPPETESDPLTGTAYMPVGTGANTVAKWNHTHKTNIPSFNSGNGGSISLPVLNPYETGNWIIKY